MRIWSKKLIKVLPDKQLKAMRYELGDMIKQYPNIKHPLVKFANNYDIVYLYSYFRGVCKEMKNKNIRMNEDYNLNIAVLIAFKTNVDDIDWSNVVFKEDDEEYLTICKWNLYEKYIRGTITKEEWEKIENV